MAQTKNKSSFRKKVDNAFMNVFALLMTLFPIFTIGAWAHYQFFSDSREVFALREVTKTPDPRLFEEPLVSVAFDDGWESVYSEAAPILSEYNIRSTQFVLPGTIDQPIYLSIEQIKSLRDAGHEIGSHTMTHADITSLDDRRLNEELINSKKFLTDLGVPVSMPFASPNGAHDDKTLRAVKKQYESYRNIRDMSSTFEQGLNVRENFNVYDINSLAVRNDTTDEQIAEALKTTKAKKAWIILIYHRIDNSGGLYSVTPDTLRRQMKLVREHNIKISTIGDTVASFDKEGR